MGKNNRERRRAKHQRRDPTARPTTRPRAHHSPGDPGFLAEGFAHLADALASDDHAGADRVLVVLSQEWEGAASAASEVLHAAVTPAWEQGWQPADLVHAMGRKLAAPDRRLLIRLVIADAPAWRAHPHADLSWLAQVDDLLGEVSPSAGWAREEVFARWAAEEGIDVVDALLRGATLVSTAWRLPILPPVGDPPSAWGRSPLPSSGPDLAGSGGDDRALARIRALLAKAESTEFPPEAEALTAKAQELAARHSIDVALLHTTAGDHGRDRPRSRRFHVHDPYAKGKSHLLAEVAAANRCQAVWSKSLGFSTVFGFSADLAMTDLLFTSLVSQCSTAMMAASRNVPNPRGFRDSFVVSFAVHIGQRLAAATAGSVEAARVELGDSLLPVLAARQDEVEAAVEESFPRLVRSRLRAGDGRGWAAGKAAADLARLEVGPALGS